MTFAFTDEQLALAQTVRDVLRAHCPPAALRSERRPAWEQLAGIGFFGLLLPPDADGLGLRLVDAVAALEETGLACLPGPVVETAVAAPYLLDDVAKLASGSVCVSVLLPGQAYAPDADLADLLVVARADGLHLVSRESVRLAPRPGADPCRRLFDVSFDESVLLDRSYVPALRRATVATAAQLIGVARHLLSVTVAYAGVRSQFGAAIGSFQAVKHQLADVAIALDFAAPLVYRAALSVDRPVPEADRDVSAAKAAAGEAAALAARVALQVHGAIGYTDELDLRFWLGRVWSLSAAYGGSAVHRARVRASVIGGDLRRYP
ncbi:acyl-CoA dehydrogenase family protein [Nonomuraea sp. NEAU-A123]|uniref:acyl-CoA dehydrogenase family protein n=1 Tax=Nonomuraea sp. NEAU-A123 TaxID=2839649 RepID=UPI001BE44282|nr:acyl-CoA dehydrogenase family protein [Nonomuraea sp. NEAU-A123]MBT2235388.1 acyl-CoA dehydrogenase family protein [Nonomuraea sp. NEAU-A123]